MSKKITIIHTTLATASTIPSMIRQMYGEAFEIVNVMDDSLLNEIKAKGKMSKEIIERFLQYVIIAKNNGSDGVLLACSSIGERADISRKVLNIPLLKIDEPMADLAVEKGKEFSFLEQLKVHLSRLQNLLKARKNQMIKRLIAY